VAPEILAAEQPDEAGLVQVAFGGAEVTLNPDQLRILYALAESDWGWLPPAGLAERLSDRPVTKSDPGPTSTKSSPAVQGEDRLLAAVDNLSTSGFVARDEADGPVGGDIVRLTADGLALITGLTRHWAGWQDYSQRFGLERY
jgi:hypothetical protein